MNQQANTIAVLDPLYSLIDRIDKCQKWDTFDRQIYGPHAFHFPDPKYVSPWLWEWTSNCTIKTQCTEKKRERKVSPGKRTNRSTGESRSLRLPWRSTAKQRLSSSWSRPGITDLSCVRVMVFLRISANKFHNIHKAQVQGLSDPYISTSPGDGTSSWLVSIFLRDCCSTCVAWLIEISCLEIVL